MTQWRALVDHDECFSFANCVATLPSVFQLDGEGKSVARDIDAPYELLREAVDGCPRAAIRIVDARDQTLYPPSEVQTESG